MYRRRVLIGEENAPSRAFTGEHDAIRGSTAAVKMLELALALAYILYDAATTEPPGVGTTVLVVVACLAEVLLVCFESCTIFKFTKSVKVFPS